jgi:ParB family chromosome partitioning protein
VKIATTGSKEIQRALNEAYRSGDLRGAKLRAVERLIATRSGAARAKDKGIVSAADLLQEYESFTDKQRALVQRASVVRERLAILTTSLKKLVCDPQFVRLLLAEGLETMPEHLMSRITSESVARS